MKILNLGSLNIDMVYDVEHFSQPGETILALNHETFCGGKGMNQSVALARAGGQVWQAGAVGHDGQMLTELLAAEGVHTELLQLVDEVSGHAIIQVNRSGQNSIIVYQGANGKIVPNYIEQVLEPFAKGDFLLIQNEIAGAAYAMDMAYAKGMQIVLNPSPITQELYNYPLHKVSYLVLNEVEGRALCNEDVSDDSNLPESLRKQYPHTNIVLTLGKKGVYYYDGKNKLYHGTYDVPVVDTTAAGDTFCGYFLAGIAAQMTPTDAIRYASLASSLTVSKKGASSSIPIRKEVELFGQCNADKVPFFPC